MKKAAKKKPATAPRIRIERFEGPASDWGDAPLVDLDAPARPKTRRKKK
jgi:hypothetical protein